MVLVTGATGLAGTHILVKLARQKHSIRALYRAEARKEQAKRVFCHYFPGEETLFDTIEWFKTTINDVPTLSEAFEGVTQVYHCAAKISFDPSHQKKLRKINIEGTANIVNLCLIHRVKKLCYMSSIATLGESPSGGSLDENAEWDPEIPNSVYAITKYGAEMEVWRGIQEGLNAVIVNPGIIIGPGFYNGGSGFLFKRIHAGMNYYTTGTTGYIAINDVVNIMYHLMIEDLNTQRYILVGENLSYKDVFDMIAKALNKPLPKKQATPYLLYLGYYLQWIGHIIFGTRRFIFKASIRSAFAHSRYKNDKVKKALKYRFTPVAEAIKETATLFLKGI